MPRITIPVEYRFWGRVHKTETCWIWMGARSSRGYGHFSPTGKPQDKVYTHRYSYELANGPIPENYVVSHTCDYPSCVNPDHLVACTQKDNILDMVRKNRHNFKRPPKPTYEQYHRGSKCPQAKLNEEQVKNIRIRFSQGEKQSKLAREYKVSHKLINDVVHNRSWKHVTM